MTPLEELIAAATEEPKDAPAPAAEAKHRIRVRLADGTFETREVTAAQALEYLNSARTWRRIG